MYIMARATASSFCKGTISKLALYSGDQTGRAAAHYAAAVPSTYDTAVLADTPVAFWPLNELAGTSAVDATGNGHTGTYTGGFTLGQSGIGDGAPSVLLNGTSGYITAANASDLNIVSGSPLSLEMWVNPTAVSGYMFLICKEAATTPHPYEWRLDAGVSDHAVILPSSSGDSGVAPSAGAWTHLVVTVSAGGSIIFYTNGVATGSTGSGGGGATGTDPLYIGTRGDFFTFFNGKIAKPAIYNKVLTPTEVVTHFAAV